MYVSIHSLIPCHCEAYSKWALHNHSLGICLFLYMNLSSWFNPLNTELNPICHLLALLRAHHILHVGRIRVKGYKLAVQYILTQDASYTSHGRDPIGSYFVTDVCTNNPQNIKNSDCIRTQQRLFTVGCCCYSNTDLKL
jgi:hypothetical protein